MGFWTGNPEKHERVSTLLPEQQGVYKDVTGAGYGAYTTAADYYRKLLSDDSADYQAFAAPEMRRYNEQIIPDLAEQFAGMGSGGLSSSGFRNAAVSAGTDLAERLGAIRAQLRAQGAQGLQNIGQTALGNYSQDVVTQQAGKGFIDYAAPIVGTAIGSFAGPVGAAVGGAVGNWMTGAGKGTTSPYGSGGHTRQSPGGYVGGSVN